jgi:hypothetical protein
MIYDSYVWKKTLKNDLKKIKTFLLKYCSNDDNGSKSNDEAFIRLQKFFVFSSIIIRKLIEANKISDEVMTNSVKISTHEKINENEITFFNDYKIDEFYDLDNPKKGTMSIVNLTNSFIHSFHFMPDYDWKVIDESLDEDDYENLKLEKLNGVYFSTDKTKDKTLNFITFEDFEKIINLIIKDNIVSMEWINGKFTKKSSIEKPISEETKKIIEEYEKKAIR